MGQKKLKEERRERTRAGLGNNGSAAAAGSSRAGKAGWTTGNAVVFTAAAVLAVIAFLVFMQSLGYDFVIWDDNILISENRNIQTLDLKFFKWVFTSVGITTWYPVTLISFAIDYAVWGQNAQGFHLTNIIFHSFNVFLVFILTVRLVEHAGPDAAAKGLNKKAFITALTTALLFGLHPLRIESVVWIAERKDVLYGFFFLLSVLAYLRYVSSDGSKKKAFYYASLVLFAMSFMSKPMAITLPLVLLILDFYPLDRLPSRLGIAGTKRVLLEKLPFFALTVLVAVITVWTNQEGGAIKKAPFFTRILVSAWGYIFYIYKTIVPIDLAPFYPYPSKVSFLSIEYSGAFIALCAITLLSVLLLKKTRLYSAAWFYYAITLVPVIGIVPIGGFAAANRYTYLPILGLLIPVGLAAGSAFERYPKRHIRALIVGAVLIVSAAYAASTVMQTPVWKDTITLWSYQMELYPGRVPIAYNNRGLAYAKLGDYRQAIEDYTVATRLDPKAARPYNNRGNAYISLKDYTHAVEDYTVAIKNNPRLTQAYNNRGNAYASLKEFEKALADYKIVLKLDPRNGMAYYNLALTYAKLGNKEEAVVNFKMAAAMGFRQAQEYLKKKAGAASAPGPGVRRP